jgi:hypothetical protein
MTSNMCAQRPGLLGTHPDDLPKVKPTKQGETDTSGSQKPGLLGTHPDDLYKYKSSVIWDYVIWDYLLQQIALDRTVKPAKQGDPPMIVSASSLLHAIPPAKAMTSPALPPTTKAIPVKPTITTEQPVEVHWSGFGSRMLQSQGWKPGEGVGKFKTGIVEPITIVYRHPRNRNGIGFTKVVQPSTTASSRPKKKRPKKKRPKKKRPKKKRPKKATQENDPRKPSHDGCSPEFKKHEGDVE